MIVDEERDVLDDILRVAKPGEDGPGHAGTDMVVIVERGVLPISCLVRGLPTSWRSAASRTGSFFDGHVWSARSYVPTRVDWWRFCPIRYLPRARGDDLEESGRVEHLDTFARTP